ncbi:MAG: hypothetical protein RR388_05825 [Rikenellaceae bacterium]
MAYKDILPQTNLAAVDIRDTIGCPSNNLADYCVKAKTGGAGGWAFKIIENGYLPTDGYLIAGAEPYFNIWSDNAPSEWELEDRGVGNMPPEEFRCRLKRNFYGEIMVKGNLFNANSYCFDLGAYRGYKHASNRVALETSYRNGIIPMSVDGQTTIRTWINYGEINWVTKFHGSAKLRLIIRNGAMGTIVASADKEWGAPNNRFDFVVNRNQFNTHVYMYLMLVAGIDEERAFVPIETNPMIFTIEETRNWFEIGNITVYDTYGTIVSADLIKLVAQTVKVDEFSMFGVLVDDFGNSSRDFWVTPIIRATGERLNRGHCAFTALKQTQQLGNFYTKFGLGSNTTIDIEVKQG